MSTRAPQKNSIRSWVQTAVFVATVATGIQFALFVHQAARSFPMTIPRPSGVEGFLPIGALMGWKYVLTTGQWDRVHPAAMVIFGFAMVTSFLFSKSFCGWFCPVGTLSEWIYSLGRFTKRSFVLPKWIDFPLRGIKYLLLGFFIWIISRMTASDIGSFLDSFYYKTSDVRMLYFFTHMSGITATFLAVSAVLSLFIRNVWCRYLCPYGALTGLFGLISPTRITRHAVTCISCGKCTAACPNRLEVEAENQVVSPECSGCMRCVNACPVDGTLTLKIAGIKKNWSEKKLGLAVVGVYLIVVYLAVITGHWETGVSDHEYQMLIPQISSHDVHHGPMESQQSSH